MIHRHAAVAGLQNPKLKTRNDNMRHAIRDALFPVAARIPRPSARGVDGVPRDREAESTINEIVRNVMANAFSHPGLYPGLAVGHAAIKFAFPFIADRSFHFYDRQVISALHADLSSHPESDRLHRAIRSKAIYSQACCQFWERPEGHYIGIGDPDFVRVCKVAAARMLSQGKLLQIVKRADKKAGIARCEYPDVCF